MMKPPTVVYRAMLDWRRALPLLWFSSCSDWCQVQGDTFN